MQERLVNTAVLLKGIRIAIFFARLYDIKDIDDNFGHHAAPLLFDSEIRSEQLVEVIYIQARRRQSSHAFSCSCSSSTPTKATLNKYGSLGSFQIQILKPRRVQSVVNGPMLPRPKT